MQDLDLTSIKENFGQLYIIVISSEISFQLVKNCFQGRENNIKYA